MGISLLLADTKVSLLAGSAITFVYRLHVFHYIISSDPDKVCIHVLHVFLLNDLHVR